MSDKTRIDKYLWAIRIYKSRSLATDACRDGKVRLHGEPVKSSTMVTTGDEIEVLKAGFRMRYRVVSIIEKRVSPVLAKVHYEDLTPPEELLKFKSWFVGKGAPERRDKGTGRPTKKDRREIVDYKDTYDGEEEQDD